MGRMELPCVLVNRRYLMALSVLINWKPGKRGGNRCVYTSLKVANAARNLLGRRGGGKVIITNETDQKSSITNPQ